MKKKIEADINFAAIPSRDTTRLPQRNKQSITPFKIIVG